MYIAQLVILLIYFVDQYEVQHLKMFLKKELKWMLKKFRMILVVCFPIKLNTTVLIRNSLGFIMIEMSHPGFITPQCISNDFGDF